MLKTSVGTLRAALTGAMMVCCRRNAIPILSQARLTLEAGVLTVSCTDLDRQIDIDATVEPRKEASTTINPRVVMGLLRFLPATDAVTLDLEGVEAFLTWPGGRSQMRVLPAADFPEMRSGGNEVKACLHPNDHAAIRRVMPFISTEETRYYLTGVCLDRIDKQPVAVATDGHRMATAPLSAELLDLITTVSKPIIPRDSARILLALFSKPSEMTMHRHNDTTAMILDVRHPEGLRFRTKLIDGAYPDWRRVIPEAAGLSIEMERTALLHALRIAFAFSARHHHSITLKADEGRAQLSVRHIEHGKLAIDVGPVPANLKVEYGFNANYMFEAVSATRGDRVTLGLGSGQFDPALVIGSERHDGENIVIMPLRSVDSSIGFSAPYREAA